MNTVFAGIMVLTACALLLDGVVGKLEKRLMKWQPRSGETEKSVMSPALAAPGFCGLFQKIVPSYTGFVCGKIK